MPSPVDTRQSIFEHLVTDLLGPSSPTEELRIRPTVEYLVGILYPADTPLDPMDLQAPTGATNAGTVSVEEAETEDAPIAEVPPDEATSAGLPDDDELGLAQLPSLAQSARPSSIGMTFAVTEKAASILCRVRYGKYSPNETGPSKLVWRREPFEYQIPISLTTSSENDLGGGARLEWTIRKQQGVRQVSVFLVNRSQRQEGQEARDEDCIFQPEVEAEGEGDSHPFVDRRMHAAPSDEEQPADADEELQRLLFRNAFQFGAGHGCAVLHGEMKEGQCKCLRTSIIPSCEIPIISPVLEIDGLDLSWSSLAHLRPSKVQTSLTPLVSGYKTWIDSRAATIDTLPKQWRETASSNLDLCREAAERMSRGISLLRDDPVVCRAFAAMNRAMMLQRAHVLSVREFRRSGKRPAKMDLSGGWRPFQLTFILLNLRAFAKERSDERAWVDLLWFPTGGGKTEAYLGLTALVLFLRRLRDPQKGAGVAVLMRYTLRLLTVQQFQRATTLICACEVIRREDPQTWGGDPFLIGLWVGAGATPNNLEAADEALDRVKEGKRIRRNNPMQFMYCPWCGQDLNAEDYDIDKHLGRLVIKCPRQECDFAGMRDQAADPDRALPALVVDDEIYRRCPSLVIGTVDKFANLPWVGSSAALFGRVDRYCPRHGYLTAAAPHSGHHNSIPARGLPKVEVTGCEPLEPPDLIIQDELHLISGPLGTLVGLYEAAVEFLASEHVAGGLVGPKIIASTATIRGAHDQVKGLFARSLRQFPAPAIDPGDTFFSMTETSEKPGKLYVGIAALGRSSQTTQIRVYASLLQSAHHCAGFASDVVDPYWTLVCYFNTLRELGGTVRLLADDVPDRIAHVADKHNEQRRYVRVSKELTSRVDSREIPEILQALETVFGSQQPHPIDVLLATNMISVGVDVMRLGLMVLLGQPKTSSEYIQATGRVGRHAGAPGLIVTIYNWSRARDMSHFESFLPYHLSLHRFVEAASVTPFSPRARDRGLHAVIVAMLRLSELALMANSCAGNIDANSKAVTAVKEYLKSRVCEVDHGEETGLMRELESVVDWWTQMAGSGAQSLRYRRTPQGGAYLLRPPHLEDTGDGSRATPMSLRDVEPPVPLVLRS